MKLVVERYFEGNLFFKKTMPNVKDVELSLIKGVVIVKFNDSFNLVFDEKKTNFNLHKDTILELIEDVDILKHTKIKIFEFDNYMQVNIVHSY